MPVPSPTTSLPPTLKWKLVTAALVLCYMDAVRNAREFVADDVSHKMVDVVMFGLGFLFALFVVFRAPPVQLLWGWVCVVCAVLLAPLVFQRIWHWQSVSDSDAAMVLCWPGMVVAGYLLAIDRQVAQFRETHPLWQPLPPRRDATE